MEEAAWETRVTVFKTALGAGHSNHHCLPVKLRVADPLRSPNAKDFDPQVLFLGFLNRPKPGKQLGWDKHKVAWARQFLAWTAFEGKLASSYDKQWESLVEILDIDVEHACEMYAMDGCVMKREVVKNVLALDALFICLYLCNSYASDEGFQLPEEFFGEDKVIQLDQLGHRAESYAFMDILLLENQLPLYILQRVFSKGFPSRVPGLDLFRSLVTGLLVTSYGQLFPDALKDTETSDKVVEAIEEHVRLDESSPHLLHCLLQLVCHAPSGQHRPAGYGDVDGWQFLESATSLHKVGISFGSPERDRPIFIHQTRFDRRSSRLLLPCIQLNRGLMLNLAACEDGIAGSKQPTHFITYFRLLNDLINTAEDVNLLVRFKLVCHSAGSDEEVAETWNNLLTPFIFAPSKFMFDITEQVHKRFNNRLPKLWTEFKRIHFGKPWYTISFLAAFVFLGLTVVQTVYSIFSYQQQH